MKQSISILTDKIRELRMSAQYTQAEVSKKLNIQRQTYCNYENASRTPPLETIVALAELYQVSVDYLVSDTKGSDCKAPKLTSSEKKLLSDFASLSEGSQKEVLNFILFKKHFPS